MRKRYFIELSRKDIGLVSYCPGLETRDDPDADWIEKVLVPAIEPIVRRKAAKIREMPITFWVTVRRTARCRAEIFLFVTPAYPGVVIERALSQALEPIKDGKVHAGIEPIPEEAVPCLQIFRGKLIRFYWDFDRMGFFSFPTICWQDNTPEVDFTPIDGIDEFMEEAGQLPVEARILSASISSGEECRKFQQVLTSVAREEQ
jgi:hypothetical protein